MYLSVPGDEVRLQDFRTLRHELAAAFRAECEQCRRVALGIDRAFAYDGNRWILRLDGHARMRAEHVVVEHAVMHARPLVDTACDDASTLELDRARERGSCMPLRGVGKPDFPGRAIGLRRARARCHRGR